MSDAVKWGLLVAAIAVIIGMITALPVFAEMDNAIGFISNGIISLASTFGGYINAAKSLVLLLIPVEVMSLLSALISFTMLSFVLLIPIKLTKQLYAWIFK